MPICERKVKTLLPYANNPADFLQHLHTDVKRGLTADVVAARQQQYGKNALKAQKKKSILVRFLDQFKDVMILILIAAAIISFVVAIGSGESSEFFEPILILAIVILNAILGVVQEGKAERALESLKTLSAPHARVLRDGEEQVIPAEDLVPGDIISIEAGDFVPADARLLESASLKSEESALTGESVAAEKDAGALLEENAPIGDRDNMVFSGCSVTYGRGVAVVTATGMDTEMGRIANLLEGAPSTQTPLQKKLAKLGKYLGIVALAACAIIFVIGLLNGIPMMEIFMTSVSLAVSAIPEGLPAIVTIVLSLGVQRMVKKNAIIRRLPAVETLGSASIICSDKTGTLTQNRMTLTKLYLADSAQLEDVTDQNSPEAQELLKYAALCCDGNIVVSEEGIQHIGDPTETAIVYAAYRNGMDKESLAAQYPRVGEVPFDSDRKLMSTIHQMEKGYLVVVKGAIDSLSPRCTQGNITAAAQIADTLSKDALRVLAVAYKTMDALPSSFTSEEVECDLTFLGLVGMIDPPRPEVRDAVAVCRQAGIKPVMITGDHVVTAGAIARDLGILTPGDKAISGSELAQMSDEELDKQVRQIAVYARVSPEDKIRIVKAWQRQGEIVSMTGDGVNDAPALKAADIGCAMGITGTDVAKNAADMTLTDDNFTTIVDAVREGRGIYDNIRKVVGFLLGTNIGEIVCVFLAMVLWHKTPLLSMQLLLINLVTDSLPAVALGTEAVEPNIMDRAPKPKNESIFAHGYGLRILLQGLMFGLLSLWGFVLGEQATGQLAGGQTMAFIVLAFSQTIHAFNMRSERSLFKIRPFTNRRLNQAALLSLAVVAIVVFVPPVATIFGLISLPATCYFEALGIGLIPIVVMEISKAVGLIKHHK